MSHRNQTLREHTVRMQELGETLLTRVEKLSSELADQAGELRRSFRHTLDEARTTRRRIHRPVTKLRWAAQDLASTVRQGYRNLTNVLR